MESMAMGVARCHEKHVRKRRKSKKTTTPISREIWVKNSGNTTGFMKFLNNSYPALEERNDCTYQLRSYNIIRQTVLTEYQSVNK